MIKIELTLSLSLFLLFGWMIGCSTGLEFTGEGTVDVVAVPDAIDNSASGVNETAPKHYESTATFRNELSDDVDLYWEGGDNVRILQDGSPIGSHGGELKFQTYPGHVFSYVDRMGQRFQFTIPEGEHVNHKDIFFVLAGNSENTIRVKCSTTTNGGQVAEADIIILVKPHWSPRGAAHFLDLVRAQYFDDSAIYRVVDNFMAQFGISNNFQQRTDFREDTFPDDTPMIHTTPQEAAAAADGGETTDTGDSITIAAVEVKIPFTRGTLAFAGAGEDSRAAEIFLILPGATDTELADFGGNSWETPFAFIENIEQSPAATWYAYGDMPPWGKGPEVYKLYEKEGYSYLKEKFPKMDYFGKCFVMNDEEEVEEEEL